LGLALLAKKIGLMPGFGLYAWLFWATNASALLLPALALEHPAFHL
jgi:hypothetical protein